MSSIYYVSPTRVTRGPRSEADRPVLLFLRASRGPRGLDNTQVAAGEDGNPPHKVGWRGRAARYYYCYCSAERSRIQLHEQNGVVLLCWLRVGRRQAVGEVLLEVSIHVVIEFL